MIYSRTGRVVAPLDPRQDELYGPDMTYVVFTPGFRYLVLHRDRDMGQPRIWLVDMNSPEPFSASDRAEIRAELARHGKHISDAELAQMLEKAGGEVGPGNGG